MFPIKLIWRPDIARQMEFIVDNFPTDDTTLTREQITHSLIGAVTITRALRLIDDETHQRLIAKVLDNHDTREETQ